jgi:RNA polymerase sigma-70 factor (ECF subfamily)
MFFTFLVKYRLIRKVQTDLIDQKLIEQCKNGNLQNFNEIIEAASPFVFSVAFRILADEEQAKDVVQDTMVTVWGKLNKINSSASFNTWLYRIVVNKCYDHLRKRKRESEFRPDDKTWAIISNHFSEQPYSELENEEIARLINFMIGKLSPKQKTVFVLSEIEEMSNEEICEITGISKTLIKANLHYARKHITEMIGKYL